MSVRAQLNVPDQRRASRHPVNHSLVAEWIGHGDLPMHIVNLSSNGFMIDDARDLARGDRVLLRLPVVGQIEAYVIWSRDVRAGFQFERLLRAEDFTALLDELQPNPRLRPTR